MNEVPAQLEALAAEQIARIEAILPEHPMDRAALFIEITRVVDACTVNPPKDDGSGYITVNDTILKWGWNSAAALLLSPLPILGAFPLAESTPAIRASASELLRALGCNQLVRRGAEMVRRGLVNANPTDRGYLIKSVNKRISKALLDNLDVDLMEETDNIKLSIELLDDWRRDDIDALMLPLMRPWHTNRGTMLAYDAAPEVDDHFLAEAHQLATKWQAEAGIHPETLFGSVTGAELIHLSIYFISFHLKHAKFVALAAQHLPEVSPIQSLTIWKPRADFVVGLADFMDLAPNRVAAIVEAIAFRADEAAELKNETTPLRPLIIDLGNGVDLWPVSALDRNPFETVRRIQQRRDPSAITRLATPRERWLREDIYALFQGNRYECIQSNIKVKVDGRILTDIDAAIYDRVNDQLALFQIKWQDYSTNNPKELVSKATNFMEAMNLWASKVETWHNAIGIERLMRTLRLRPSSQSDRTKVFLFGISRSMARLGEMAGQTPAKGLALANWAQFLRARYEVGPVDNVLAKLHERFVAEYEAEPRLVPLPIVVEIAGTHIEFSDNFFRVTSDEEPEPAPQ